jgi:rRNA maturation endonuclease Nob1
MNKDLEKLIDLALADGVLSDKEKQVLNKKAQELGVDQDEFEMVLEARLHLRQKEGTSSKQKDNVIKCPSCNDIVPGLSKVCPSCGFVIDSGRKSSESEKGLEDLISDIEDNLVEIKSIKPPNIFTTLFHHSYISLPILSIIMFVIGFRLQSAVGLLGLVLAFISWRVIKKKMREDKSDDDKPTFNNLKATFEKHSRTANTLFGENKKVKLLLEELNNELGTIDAKRKKGKTTEYIFYGIITLITVGVFFIPQAKNKYESDAEIKSAESSLIIKAEGLIKEDKISEVNQVLSEIKSEDNKVLVRSKIQLHELTKQIDALEPLLASKKFSEIKLSLSKIIWEKISTEYETESVERDVYKSFLKRKEALNNQLPEKQRIEIESEYSL